jgi:hypothetical protein
MRSLAVGSICRVEARWNPNTALTFFNAVSAHPTATPAPLRRYCVSPGDCKECRGFLLVIAAPASVQVGALPAYGGIQAGPRETCEALGHIPLRALNENARVASRPENVRNFAM